MKKTLYATLFLAVISSSAPSFAATYKDLYCAKKDKQFLADAIVPENRLAFGNKHGALKMGLCWWHSRFERAALYLAVFVPPAKKPTQEQAIEIIRKLITRKSVVVIPGFKNLKEFSEAFQYEIIDQLNAWQIKDGFINQFWIKGLVGKSKLPADELRTHMDNIYKTFKKTNRLLSAILQLPGFDVHMWNIAGMEKTKDGYRLTVTDSNNYPGYYNDYYSVAYRHGDTHLGAASIIGGKEVYMLTDEEFVPYLSMNNLDLGRIDEARSAHCK